MSETPLFRYASDAELTVRQMALSGRGVRLQCQRCHRVAERTVLELLERHWRAVDAPLSAIMMRTSCPACGARSVTLSTIRGSTPFPAQSDCLSWERAAEEERRNRRLEDWLAARQTHESRRTLSEPPAS